MHRKRQRMGPPRHVTVARAVADVAGHQQQVLTDGAFDEDDTWVAFELVQNVQKFLRIVPVDGEPEISVDIRSAVCVHLSRLRRRFEICTFQAVKDTLDLLRSSLTGLTSLAITARNVIGITSGACPHSRR
jgi:hypothetical protein